MTNILSISSSLRYTTANNHNTVGGAIGYPYHHDHQSVPVMPAPGAAAAANKNHSSSNGGVHIGIQYINHTNPININSPSGMNNVASMATAYAASGLGHQHQQQQHQILQQQQQHC